MDFQERLETADVRLALKWARAFKWLRVCIALVLLAAYQFDFPSFMSWLVGAVMLLLFLPMGFTDTFLEKLLEYNTSTVEKRQVLNANETNKQFKEMARQISALKHRLKELEAGSKNTFSDL